MKILLLLLAFFWELPQTILASIIYVIFFREIKSNTILDNFCVLFIIKKGKFTGVSLGRFIFLAEDYANYNTIRHEVGHSWQSLFLGWLYLLIIGIPSFIQSRRGL